MSPSYRRKGRKSSSKRSINLSKCRKHLYKSSDESCSTTVSPATSACCSATSEGGDNAEPWCSTPKAERFRIPEISTCPPAPKKRRLRNAAAFTLRRTPLPFFAHPDIELFFYFALRGIHV